MSEGRVSASDQQDQELAKAFLQLKSREQLAAFLGVSFTKHLVYYLYRIPESQRYRTFEIPKRGGGTRTISAPASGLKLVQQRLNNALQAVYKPRANVHGFIQGRGITTNAEAHVRQRHVLNIDLENFFGTINFGRVRGLFGAAPLSFPVHIATTLAQICCHENRLPQGAPTSPIIANMIAARLDTHLKQLAQSHRCRYTRYADDITISTAQRAFPIQIAYLETQGDERQIVLAPELLQIISANGFSVKTSKTRLLSRMDRQEVTGLTVNKFVNVDRKYIRSIRGALHAWRKFGTDNAEDTFRARYNFSASGSLSKTIYGRIQYVGSIRGWDDPLYIKLRNDYNDISTRLKIPVRPESWDETVFNAIWVIESDSDIHQGTAVFIKGYGLVTCAHCVGESPLIYHPRAPSQKFPVEVVSKNDAIDLAILRITGRRRPSFSELLPQAFQSTLTRGEAVKLLGYPQHAPGREFSEKEGKIQSFTTRSGIRRFNISAAIIAGNSGGPVINRYRRVAGIAVTGADNTSDAANTEDHGVIPIGALQHLFLEPVAAEADSSKGGKAIKRAVTKRRKGVKKIRKSRL